MLLPAPMYQYPSALPCTANTVSRLSPMAADSPHFAIALCRPNSQNGVSATKGSIPDHESCGLWVDIEGAGGYFPHPPRRLQGAPEREEMRCGDLRRQRARQQAQQVLIRAGCQVRRVARRAQIAHQGAHRCADAALDGEMQQLGNRGGTRNADAHGQMNPAAHEFA